MTGRTTGPRRVPGDVLVHLRRTRDHLDRHFAEPFDLDHLARLAQMSRFHFIRSFAMTYGRTPAAYLAERRVERAQDLLRAANLTVTEVCHAVGYSSLGSFSSRFREIVGESPATSSGATPRRGTRGSRGATSSWPGSSRGVVRTRPQRRRSRTAHASPRRPRRIGH